MEGLRRGVWAWKQEGGQGLSTRNVIGILALFCAMSEFAILTPSIAAFSHHLVGTDITTIMFANSITGIVSVPVSVLSGAILHRVGFKPVAIGILVMSLGVLFPFLMPDITDYAARHRFARHLSWASAGVMFPVETPISSRSFEGEKRSRLLGLGIAIQFLFNLIYTTVCRLSHRNRVELLVPCVPYRPREVVALVWMPGARALWRRAASVSAWSACR